MNDWILYFTMFEFFPDLFPVQTKMRDGKTGNGFKLDRKDGFDDRCGPEASDGGYSISHG